MTAGGDGSSAAKVWTSIAVPAGATASTRTRCQARPSIWPSIGPWTTSPRAANVARAAHAPSAAEGGPALVDRFAVEAVGDGGRPALIDYPDHAARERDRERRRHEAAGRARWGRRDHRGVSEPIVVDVHRAARAICHDEPAALERDRDRLGHRVVARGAAGRGYASPPRVEAAEHGHDLAAVGADDLDPVVVGVRDREQPAARVEREPERAAQASGLGAAAADQDAPVGVARAPPPHAVAGGIAPICGAVGPDELAGERRIAGDRSGREDQRRQGGLEHDADHRRARPVVRVAQDEPRRVVGVSTGVQRAIGEDRRHARTITFMVEVSTNTFSSAASAS